MSKSAVTFLLKTIYSATIIRQRLICQAQCPCHTMWKIITLGSSHLLNHYFPLGAL